MRKDNIWCTGLDSMEETVSYLILQGWSDIDSAKDFNLLSTIDEQRSTRRADRLYLQAIQN
jgi:hypothetical protein